MLPHGFELATDDFLHAISDSIKTADCGIDGVPGTVTALCWEAGERKAQMCLWELQACPSPFHLLLPGI